LIVLKLCYLKDIEVYQYPLAELAKMIESFCVEDINFYDLGEELII